MNEIVRLADKYKDCTDTMEAYVLLNMIKNAAEELQAQIKPELENGKLGTTNYPDLGYMFSLIEMQKGTLDIQGIKSELSTDEMVAKYKPTEADLKAMGHKELIEKYKTVNPVRQIRVSKIA